MDYYAILFGLIGSILTIVLLTVNMITSPKRSYYGIGLVLLLLIVSYGLFYLNPSLLIRKIAMAYLILFYSYITYEFIISKEPISRKEVVIVVFSIVALFIIPMQYFEIREMDVMLTLSNNLMELTEQFLDSLK